MPDAALLAALQAAEADLGLLTEPADTERFATDATRRPEVVPGLVIRPRDTAAVSRAMALCHRHGARVVVQGGLTGLSGGARVQAGEVVLSLERVTTLDAPDPDTMQIRAGAGVRLQQVQDAADQADLYFGVDLGARGTATIGGCVATNAGGIRVMRYGMFRAQVAGLTAVLTDGTVISTMRALDKDNAGPDLKQLFIGSEGTFGIVTEAVLRLHPKPTLERNALCAVDGPEQALALLRHLRGRLGGFLSAFEGLWPDVYAGASAIAGVNPLAEGAGLYILTEVQGPDGAMRDGVFEEALMEALEAGLCHDIVVSQSRRDYDGLWRLREACPEFTFSLGRLLAHDLSLPLSRVPAFITAAAETLGAVDPAAKPYVYGHLGDGNLHYVVDTDQREAVAQAINGLAASMNGSITAEHGVGVDKAAYLPLVRGDAERALMARLKAGLDPDGVLNAGRVFGAS